MKSYDYMKRIINDPVTTCDEISDKVAKSYSNTAESALINSNDKTATYKLEYNILHTLLLVALLLLIIAITCY